MNTLDVKTWTRQLSWLAALFLILLVSQWQAFQGMVGVWWNSQTFNHCMIIPALSAWIIYNKKQTWDALTPQFSTLGLAALFFACVTLLVATYAQVNAAIHLALIVSVISLVWITLGDKFAQANMFALAYLLFAVPFGEFLVPRLQDVTAEMAVYFLQLTGIPVFTDGRLIEVPNGSFLVAEACSGISYLIAALALGTLFAHLYYVSYWRKTLFVALSFIVPVVANGIRAYLIIFIAHKTDNEYAVGVDHLIYGWIFFGIVIFLMFAVGQLFAEKSKSLDEEKPLATKVRAGLSWRYAGIAAMALMLINGYFIQRESVMPSGSFVLAVDHDDFSKADQEPLSVRYVGAKETHLIANDKVVSVIAYFPRDERSAELVSSSHRLFNNNAWNAIANPKIRLAEVELTGYKLKNGANEILLMVEFALFADGVPVSDYVAKWRQFYARLTGAAAPAARVMFMVREADVQELQKGAITQLIDDVAKSLEQAHE